MVDFPRSHSRCHEFCARIFLVDGLELFFAKLYEKILLISNFLQNHSHSFMSKEIKNKLNISGSNYRKIISWWLFTNQGS